jgi:hypothetical protein
MQVRTTDAGRIAPMAELSPAQEKTRERVESLIGLAAPALDLILAAGDRISRAIEPEDHDYYPVRPLEAPKVRPPR